MWRACCGSLMAFLLEPHQLAQCSSLVVPAPGWRLGCVITLSRAALTVHTLTLLGYTGGHRLQACVTNHIRRPPGAPSTWWLDMFWVRLVTYSISGSSAALFSLVHVSIKQAQCTSLWIYLFTRNKHSPCLWRPPFTDARASGSKCLTCAATCRHRLLDSLSVPNMLL